MKDKKAYNKVRKARTSLVLKHPFFASLALRLTVQEDYNCHTAWTDGKVFAYNPHYINILSDCKLEGLTAHTVMHPACNHHLRRGDRDSVTWNKACDYVINGILLDAGFTLPDGFLYKKDMAHRSAESAFEILQGGESDSDGVNEESSSENEEEKEQHDEQLSQQEENGKVGETDGEKEEEDDQTTEATDDPGLSGEVRDAEETGSAGGDTQEKVDWDEAVIQAAITARGMGELPGGIARMLEGRTHTVMGWRELLARFVERATRSDYSWLAPNRRYIHQGLYLPSLKNSEIGDIHIAIDTSGSIGEKDLAQFSVEIAEIATSFSTTLELIHCDTKIVKTEQIEPHQGEFRLQPVGGGGTDFRPVFTHIENSNQIPTCLIYLSDLECSSYPKAEPHYPVLWVKVGDGTRIPPFGELIHLHSDRTSL